MNVTIKDLANELGLSFSSVSRALNNKAGVSKETREKVQAYAKKYGYKPNELARSLVNQNTNTIGVILPDLKNDFFSEILQGIVDAAAKINFTVLFCVSNWDSIKEREYIDELQKRQISGLILKRTREYTIYTKQDLQVPTVLIENWHSSCDFSYVEVDDRKGGSMATSHLLECGYKNIAFLGGFKSSRSCIMRVKGYIDVLKEHNLPVIKNRILYGEFSSKSGYEMTKTALKRDPKIDAFFTNNDVIALGALQYLDEAGIKVPEEIGVVGFDNISLASMPRISLTTINQPKAILGRNAFDMLLEQIDGNAGKRLIYQPELIKRNTTINH